MVGGGLDPGESATFVLTVQSPSGCSEPQSDVFINRVTVSSSNPDSNTANNAAEVSTQYQDTNC